MFDLIDEELFFDAVWELFSVLEEQYTRDQCKELLPRLQATFDQIFETRFIIIDRKTGNPINVNAVLNTRDAAETCLKIVGEQDHEIGFLLIER